MQVWSVDPNQGVVRYPVLDIWAQKPKFGRFRPLRNRSASPPVYARRRCGTSTRTGAGCTAKDPIGFGGGDTVLYAYVGGDPVNGVGPTGLRPLMDIEEAWLRVFFGDSFVYSELDVNAGLLRYPWTPAGGNLRMTRDDFQNRDPGQMIDIGSRAALVNFVHEAFHVWQRQHGIDPTTAQICDSLNFGGDDFALPNRSQSPAELYEWFIDPASSPEQQARIVGFIVNEMLLGNPNPAPSVLKHIQNQPAYSLYPVTFPF